MFEGAMVSLNFKPAAPSDLRRTAARRCSTAVRRRARTAAERRDNVPTLVPPIYGEHPAKRHTVDAREGVAALARRSQLSAALSAGAGWGAEVVRQNQDEFMQAAWEQVGDVLAAERAFSLARLSRDVLKSVEARHLAKLPPERLLAILAPARVRIRVSPTQSLYGQIESATLPHELFDGSMRRPDQRAAADLPHGAVARPVPRARRRSPRRWSRSCGPSPMRPTISPPSIRTASCPTA